MTRTAIFRASIVLWIVAAAVFGLALARALRVEWAYLPGAAPPRVEDRRAHRFRDLTYGETERLLRTLLRQLQNGQSPRDRAVALARAAALQRERGYVESSRAAGQKALQLSADDARTQAEIRAILNQPLRVEDVVDGGRGARP